MVNPVTFPRVGGTTATYLHPLLQSTVLQSTVLAAAAKPSEAAPSVTQAAPPAVPAVAAVQPTAAYADNLARDAATAVRTAAMTAKTNRANEKMTEVDPFDALARQAVIDRTSSQVGVLLTRAAAERRVALTSGLPAARLAQIDTTTSRLYHALDVLI
ncbi:hypothetical protein M1L60_15915 [Actinoplanes sp. TRM 88003]|uniref:Uncharacterized protein n=1 Tax=Paractinoplanes aksuensis TaxID=2939490 RepID=A0ABT1DPZ7_9ACTN|nr:hypothetical protein [Actinoplanes aksuensis]MCO8272080.1 hypothetical protein [Actinoplanes aksuensis]